MIDPGFNLVGDVSGVELLDADSSPRIVLGTDINRQITGLATFVDLLLSFIEVAFP
jgi:hypothetical protein